MVMVWQVLLLADHLMVAWLYKIATCPTIPDGDDAVGRWMYLPYHFDHDKCYTPDGRPLSLKQFIFRHRYRKHLPVVAAVGMLSGADGGGRNKAFYTIELYKSHYDCDVSLEDINDVLAEKLDPHKLQNYIKGIVRSVAKDKYTEEYYRLWIVTGKHHNHNGSYIAQ